MHFFQKHFHSLIKYFESWGLQKSLQVLLCLGLLQGVIYTFIIPPWWHYDEPTQFEYAWLMANKTSQINHNTVDEEMQSKLAASMLKYGYYDFYVHQPDLTFGESIYIGVSQKSDPPLYYWVVSRVLWLTSNSSFEFQNYITRLVSVLMFLGVIYFCWKLVGELVGEGHLFQWIVTCFIVLLPGLTDTMTSINNDVLAVFIFSLFVWQSIICLKYGLTLERFVFLILTVASGYYSKNTVYPIIGLALFVFLYSAFNRFYKWVPYFATAVGVVVLVTFSFRLGDPAYWFRTLDQPFSARVLTQLAPFGDYAFRIDEKGSNKFIGQFITSEQIKPFRKKVITIGAWVWSKNIGVVPAPEFSFVTQNGKFKSEEKVINLTPIPTFVSVKTSVPHDAIKGWVTLYSAINGSAIYYDGITLVPQEFLRGEPVYKDDSLRNGIWDGLEFQNAARNPSAESGWIWLNPQARQLLAKISNFMADSQIFVSALQDYDGAGGYFRASALLLFETFWAKPARAKIYLLGGKLTYDFLKIVSIAGVLGTFALILRKQKILPWNILLFLSLSFVSVWIITVIRGGSNELLIRGLTPWARYAFPAIIPTALLLCGGWYAILKWISRITNSTDAQSKWLFFSFMSALNFLNLISIIKFFYLKEEQVYAFMFGALLISFLVIILKSNFKKQETKNL